MNIPRLAVLALVILCWWQTTPGQAAAFLFDATKAETAGNADWVVDEDNHIAGRYPTPPASGITSTTDETYWTGALSSWGVTLVQLGHSVEQLPVGGRITYLDTTNDQDLSHYQVYVVCEPNILFTAAEKSAVVRYVQAGGSLFVISDHTGSDRNNDGYDSVAIWNDLFSNNGVVANPFGVTVNSVSVSLVSSYIDTAADDPLIYGPLGTASLLQYSSGATLTINPAANANVRAAFWSSSAHGNANVMVAWGSFGAGRFAVVGDSSPSDDGTGSSGHTLYADWTAQNGNHARLYLNASAWLAAANSGVPYNDNFASAAPLGPAATSATGTNVGATKETGEPNHAGNAGGASIWWQFTAANSGTATVTTAGSDFDTLLAVYTGSAVNALTTVAANDNVDGSHTSSAVSFPVTAGTTYRVAVDGANGATGHITLSLALPGPANDAFANAAGITYSGTAVALTGNNDNATAETGEPNHAGIVGGRSVWWRWTASTSGAVTLSTAGSDFDTLLAVYTGTAVNALTSVASNDNYGTSLQSLLSFNAVAGTVYRIAVDGAAGAMGNVALALSPGNSSNIPVNDNFVNALPLSGASLTTTAVTTYATKETGEPNHGGNAGGHSVWWRWNAPGDGTVTIDTVGSSFDTTMGVYTGAAVNALTTLASDDDGAGNLKSKVVVSVAADTTYDIAVDGYGTAKGNVTLNLSFVGTAPPNDDFANATVLSGTAISVTGTNLYATQEAGETNVLHGHTVWYQWTASADLHTSVSALGRDDNSMAFDIYRGTALNALTRVTSGAGSNPVDFDALSGVTYFVRVDDFNGGPGGFTLGLTAQALPTVSVVASTPQAAEKGTVPGAFTITFDAGFYEQVNVSLALTGTAVIDADYSTAPAYTNNGTVTIAVPAFTTSVTISITPVDDNDPTEGDETVVGTLVTAPLFYRLSSAASTATVTIRDDSPYTSAWEGAYRPLGFSGASAAPTADPDGDGWSNLLEFAFNLNPLAADPPAALPTVGTGVFSDPADPAGATHRYATLTFTRRTDAPNLTYSVEATTDPATGTWNANGAVFVSASTAGMAANTEKALYRAASPMDGPKAVGQQFLRVRVSATVP